MPTEDLDCDLCGTFLGDNPQDDEIASNKKRNHYMLECKAIPSEPLSEIPTKTSKASITRIAALGEIKRIGRVDTIRDLSSIPSSSRSMSNTSDVYISLQEEPPD